MNKTKIYDQEELNLLVIRNELTNLITGGEIELTEENVDKLVDICYNIFMKYEYASLIGTAHLIYEYIEPRIATENIINFVENNLDLVYNASKQQSEWR